MKDNPFTPAQRNAALDLRGAWPSQKIVLIGASALACSLEMHWRRTNDLDLTIVADQAEIATKLQALGWIRHPHFEQRWTSPGDVQVDILPSTPANLSEGRLRFEESGHVMNLAGFDLALRHHFPIDLDGTVSLDVATVPVIVVLKMTAWLDRPSERERDLADLAYVFDDYLDAKDMRRWQDDLIEAGLSPENQSAFAIGQDVRSLIEDTHQRIVTTFLDAVTDDGSTHHAQFAKHFRGSLVARNEASAILVERLQAFRRGLETPILKPRH